ncbi:MAG TPA: tyrosine-type recombinase/integrase [Planctomycetota bacterium]|nr:tyrosine-type recombinase/integrase [Planctomycetota bacterium]
MHLAQALDAFLLQLAADGRSEHTIGQYRRHVGALDRWLAATRRSRRLADIDHETLALFLTSAAARCRPDGKTKRATSTNALRTSLRAAWAYWHASGAVTVNAARLIRRARCAPPPPRALSDEEVRRLLAAVQGDTPALRRDEALLKLLASTGVRLSSALNLRVEDVDLAAGELHVRRTKGDAPVTLPLSRAAVHDLRGYLRERRDGYLFPGEGGPLNRRQAGRRIEEAAARAGLSGRATAHSLRHSFACALLAKTGNLAMVQQALAHRSIASTVVYARVDRAGLREALRG